MRKRISCGRGAKSEHTNPVLKYMWGKQTVSAEEMSQTLWKMCGSFTDDFCPKLTPKLQAQGFLRDPAEKDAFAIEALQLHIWLISYVFTDDGAVLDALHNIFAAWDAAHCQARASQTVRERFACRAAQQPVGALRAEVKSKVQSPKSKV